jgi:hypothetical protein
MEKWTALKRVTSEKYEYNRVVFKVQTEIAKNSELYSQWEAERDNITAQWKATLCRPEVKTTLAMAPLTS